MAATIYAREGLAGFTHGMAGRVLWVAPSTAIMFSAYDKLVAALRLESGDDVEDDT